MSFLLPISEQLEGCACLLESEALTPGLLAAMGLSDGHEPIYALWGGGEVCIDLLLSAVSDEAANRALAQFVCRAPNAPHHITALWVDGVGILMNATDKLPDSCRLIDLSGLSTPLNAEQTDVIARLKAQSCAITADLDRLGHALSLLEQSAHSLTAPIHLSDALTAKAVRISSAQADGGGQVFTLPISAVSGTEGMIRTLPFCANDSASQEKVRLIGLSELYGVAGHFLSLLSDALQARGADHIRLIDHRSGILQGIWIPSGNVCYLTDPPACRLKMMTLSRYLIPRTTLVRQRCRALEKCGGAIVRQMADRAGQMAEITERISEVQRSAIKKNRFSEFRKRFLIELFCK